MAAPTFVSEYESSWSVNTTPKTVTPTTAAGDVLVVGGMTADSVTTLNTPTGNSLTYTLKDSSLVGSNVQVYGWTALDAVGGTAWTMSVARAGTANLFGFNALRFSGSSGIGASNHANGTGNMSIGLTTTQDNSAVVVFFGDWNADDGVSRVWGTVNSITPTAGNGLERTYFRDAANYTVYAAYWNDVGVAGAKTFGLTGSGTMKWSAIAIEVKGTGGISHPGLGSVAAQTRPAGGKLAAKTTTDGSAAQTRPAGGRLASKAAWTGGGIQTRPVGAKVAVRTGSTTAVGQVLSVGGKSPSRPSSSAGVVQSRAVGSQVVGHSSASAEAAVGQCYAVGRKVVAAQTAVGQGVVTTRPAGAKVAVRPATSATAATTRPIGAKVLARGAVGQGVGQARAASSAAPRTGASASYVTVYATTVGRAVRSQGGLGQAACRAVSAGRRVGSGVGRGQLAAGTGAVGVRRVVHMAVANATGESYATFSTTPPRQLRLGPERLVDEGEIAMPGRYGSQVVGSSWGSSRV